MFGFQFLGPVPTVNGSVKRDPRLHGGGSSLFLCESGVKGFAFQGGGSDEMERQNTKFRIQ